VSTPRSAGPRSQASGRNRSSTASDHLLWPPRRPPPQPAQTFSSPRPPGSRWTSERSGRQHALRRALRRAGPARRRRVHSRHAAPPTSPRHHPAANTAFAPKELTIHRPTWLFLEVRLSRVKQLAGFRARESWALGSARPTWTSRARSSNGSDPHGCTRYGYATVARDVDADDAGPPEIVALSNGQ
jgi:hypothetical protein